MPLEDYGRQLHVRLHGDRELLQSDRRGRHLRHGQREWHCHRYHVVGAVLDSRLEEALGLHDVLHVVAAGLFGPYLIIKH